MTSTTTGDDNNNLIQKTLEWIADAGINGLGVLPSAKQVAEDHLSKSATIDDAINSLIAWRTTYAAGTGFVTGLGGIATMPITIPAGLVASYALGANTSAAVAYLRGYDIRSQQVRIVD
ncbi:hypothetical protein [Calothrix sp. PCC 6303]|uniref:hypothetical protein n=1 Tax=Calothrix sp. PCC 6303 TaxID=1170562 RepID=UPI0002E9123C|nr:hypothetical protein [Calothrix sp. PCC 6303]